MAQAEVTQATLDDVLLALTGRSLRESAVADEPADASPAPVLEEVRS